MWNKVSARIVTPTPEGGQDGQNCAFLMIIINEDDEVNLRVIRHKASNKIRCAVAA